MTPAPPLRRVLASLIDLVILAAIILFFTFLIRLLFGFIAVDEGISFSTLFPIIHSVEGLVSLVAIIAYISITTWYFGATVGKSLFKLKVTDFEGNPITLRSSFIRTFSYLLSCWTYGIGFFVGLVRKDRIALHDFVSNTKVLLIQEGLIKSDTKSLSVIDLNPFEGT